ncbi:sugar phosphate nucleotidyltransferase [Trichococcus collinsii]|uniref:Mannose-1-phosphate guanylyltransferase n=1 Tax=Trichococcus collinsii TaxID=157076 RepID=A0AB38A0V0_9LACT|nr:sugar phosphate nucleotidyltransferase [Trichococcus collinsii]CZQ91368.1 mannose-6-phosphate isomerase [Trichococcus collinsii]SEA54626.1 mannose-1-phosphate guanylyltransferase [Trichococcus collinsii]
MKIILLSGGSGTRLWPLSNDIRSKQFLKLLKDDNGEAESMVQRVYRQIRQTGIDADLVIATGKNQKDSIQSQLGDLIDVVLEPERRDTFPAIALASSYLYFEKNMDEDEAIVVLPVDPYAELEYFDTLKSLKSMIESDSAKIGLMGIEPTYPSAKYGYILRNQVTGQVQGFQEKPTEEFAKSLIEDGAMWNGGVFAFKASYIMNILRKYISFSNFEDVRNQYAELPKISFDYEVIEHEQSISMVEYSGIWKDLGTWNTLTEVMDSNAIGKVVLSEDSNNTHVINELDIPITVLGANNMVIAASPDGILVSDKHESSKLKSYVEGLSKRPMYEESGWGDSKVLDFSENEDGSSTLTKSIFIKAGESLHYQQHAVRDEIWTIIDGSGDVVIDDHVRNVRRGDVAYILKGQKHSIRAITNLRLIEVEIGTEIVDDDVKNMEWAWK